MKYTKILHYNLPPGRETVNSKTFDIRSPTKLSFCNKNPEQYRLKSIFAAPFISTIFFWKRIIKNLYYHLIFN